MKFEIYVICDKELLETLRQSLRKCFNEHSKTLSTV